MTLFSAGAVDAVSNAHNLCHCYEKGERCLERGLDALREQPGEQA